MVNLTIDGLIESGHSEAASLAEWKDGINESWADLLELIDTRAQLLTASYDLLKWVQENQENGLKDFSALNGQILLKVLWWRKGAGGSDLREAKGAARRCGWRFQHSRVLPQDACCLWERHHCFRKPGMKTAFQPTGKQISFCRGLEVECFYFQKHSLLIT